MVLCASGRRGFSRKALGHFLSPGNAHLPVFLCPIVLRATHTLNCQPRLVLGQEQRSRSYQQRRRLHAPQESKDDDQKPSFAALITRRLPLQCGGCGAFSQVNEKDEPGFYTLTRRTVKDYLYHNRNLDESSHSVETEHLRAVLENHPELRAEFDAPASKVHGEAVHSPVCDRCHKLLHHHEGVSISHPTIQSIQDTIFETPHKYNHVYHIIDAADFPMSLIPGIHRLLHLTPQRSLNRRSKTGRFYHGKKTEVSFIITRSDLLAPLKTQVDSMMPYLAQVLRDALGSTGKEVRLGNVRCVSAKRSWWTKELKEDVWNRGGAGWMVGKVNVGKSQLFESIFPKGRRGAAKMDRPLLSTPATGTNGGISHALEPTVAVEDNSEHTLDVTETAAGFVDLGSFDTDSLLPPAPPEVNYPAMPLVSSLPGTTASPIRLPFGNGKGELIDLPGLSRGDLERYVMPEHRSSLVMKSRVRPVQQVIKPGQSLLLGGFIRITPTTPDLIFLSYSFTPIKSHLTSTEKAVGIQNRELDSGVENIADPEIAAKIKSAGKFCLEWDVTKKRTGPLMEKSAAGLKASVLPYRVMSADILIEGCGWVELVAQVRKKSMETPYTHFKPLGEREDELAREGEILPPGPEVEVFSPEGRFIGVRRPMGAWLLHDNKPGDTRVKGRPRKSMKGTKKLSKIRARENSD